MRHELVTTARWHAFCFSIQVCILFLSPQKQLPALDAASYGQAPSSPLSSASPWLASQAHWQKAPLREWTGCFLTLLWFVYTLNSHLTQRLDAGANSSHLRGLTFGDVVYCWISPLLSLHAESLNSYSISSSKELSAGWGLGRVCMLCWVFFPVFYVWEQIWDISMSL